jgi:hypothetical protein
MLLPGRPFLALKKAHTPPSSSSSFAFSSTSFFASSICFLSSSALISVGRTMDRTLHFVPFSILFSAFSASEMEKQLSSSIETFEHAAVTYSPILIGVLSSLIAKDASVDW